MGGVAEIRGEDGRAVDVPRLCLDYVPPSMVGLPVPVRAVSFNRLAVLVRTAGAVEQWIPTSQIKVIATAVHERPYIPRWLARKTGIVRPRRAGR